MRALGTLVDVDPADELTRFEYFLPLGNTLMHVASESGRADADHFEELAQSYSRDTLSLANLASRLLWFEGVTPDVWRSYDLVSVDVDASSYFVTLQTACDIMADAIATLGTNKGQAPTESFHSLVEWVKRNPNRMADEFRFIGERLPWFEEINSVRTKLVHRGGDFLIYTNRVRFQWAVHLHRLRKKPMADVEALEHGDEKQRERIVLSGFLLMDLRRLTRSLLGFSGALARRIARHQHFSRIPRKHVISGAFVPALHHMVRHYEPPEASPSLILSAKCLVSCGDYATAGYLGYPEGFWWRFLVHAATGLGTAPETSTVPVRADDEVHDARIVFACKGQRYGLILCDELNANSRWVREAGESAQKFARERSLARTIFVARHGVASGEDELRDACAALLAVIESDPKRAADEVLSKLPQ